MPLRLLKAGPCQESISILRVLLKRARQADVRGIALCYRSAQGRDIVFITGVFRAKPASALTAVARIAVASVQLELFS